MRVGPIIGIIPARYASTRFPGKPLVPILGKPMFWHVYTRARACESLREVYLATDDERIREAAERLGVPVVMTSTEHASGTDRILEAARTLDLDPRSVVVNIQGDEPALEPDMLRQLTAPFEVPEVQVCTLVRRMNHAEALDPNRVKAVWSERTGLALYFSRSLVPHFSQTEGSYWVHIGLYAYRFPALVRFNELGPSPLELIERLEQLRFLEAGIPIRVVPTEHRSVGVDRPQDLDIVTSILKEYP
jgi:3-deoxy-manno-octulosonate cytidylyltransferase (CMP-KDO synthetase)